MRKDREQFMNRNKPPPETIPTDNTEEIKVGKWERKKSSEKRDSSRDSPRFGFVDSPPKE